MRPGQPEQWDHFVDRVISVRISDFEEARLRGGAAITGMSLSAYLRWLVTGGKTGTQNNTEMILRKLDLIAVAIAKLGTAAPAEHIAPVVGPSAKDALVNGLKARGIPSSTIRQVEAVLDEIEKRNAGETRPS